MWYATRTDYGHRMGFGVGSGGTNRGCYDFTQSKWQIYYDSSNVFHLGISTTGGSNQPIYINSSGTPTTCNSMMPLSGSTFTGAAYAYTNTNYTTYQLRNIAFTTSTPSSLTNGYVCMVYS